MDILKMAGILKAAENGKTPVDPVTSFWEDIDLSEAYAVQVKNIEEKIKEGDRITGMKIGLTSRGMMELIGVNEPDFGHLLESMEVSNRGEIKRADLLLPKAEGELAFVLKEDLKGPGLTSQDVINATAYVVPSIEIVDSRIKDWKIKLLDTVADNGSSSRYILGDTKLDPREIDMKLTGMLMEKNGKLINSGVLAEVFGNPVESVAWLANKLSEFGIVLKKDYVILSGAVTAAVPADKGDSFKVSFHGMGDVEVTFI